MAVVAVTRILFGQEDGSVKEIGIGETVSGLSEDAVRDLVVGGSAVETGKSRKYSAPAVPLSPDDELTRKRDEIILKARLQEEEDAQKDSVEPRAEQPAASATSAAAASTTATKDDNRPSTGARGR